MFKYILTILITAFLSIAGTLLWIYRYDIRIISPLGKNGNPIIKIDKPLEKYEIKNLANRTPAGSPIVFDEIIATESGYIAQKFHYFSGGKRVSGLAHLPVSEKSSLSPIVIQCRGYVDQKMYEPGIGTQRSAIEFAKHGFVSLAPDFLGFGTSDPPSRDVFEERFETYTTVLDLIDSVGKTQFMGDPQRIFLWGHSNGGHIALTILAITGASYPTVLWAPVSKSFPYSILYYTDEADDYGKSLRRELSKFEALYDVDLFSASNYLDRIKAPIEIHQGTADEAVPVVWSNLLVDQLKERSVDVTYFTYPGADHNLTNTDTNSWSAAVLRSISFYTQYL